MNLLRNLVRWFYYQAGYRTPHYEDDEARARITLYSTAGRDVRAMPQDKENK